MLEFFENVRSDPVLSKKVPYLAATKHSSHRSSPLRLLALKPDLFRSHYDLGLWQHLVYNCMYLPSQFISLSLFIEILLTKLDCSYIGIGIDLNFPKDSETPKPNPYQRTPCTHPIFGFFIPKWLILINIYTYLLKFICVSIHQVYFGWQ